MAFAIMSMQKSNIEYLAAVGGMTWNPIAMRCSPVSAGCAKCWHIRMARRLAENRVLGQRQQDAYKGGSALLLKDQIGAPIRRSRPTLIAVQFMGDLFHDSVTHEQRVVVWGTMHEARQHTFLVLTKRAARLLNFMKAAMDGGYKPVDHIWIGVSVDNISAKSRIDEIRSIPANLWISVEPLLEDLGHLNLTGIAWVAGGAETGHGKRGFKNEWWCRVTTQCDLYQIPCFSKVDGNGKAMGPRHLPNAFAAFRR
jgi:protein gp37